MTGEKPPNKPLLDRLVGKLDLTQREAEVAAWMSLGKTNAEVASTLGIRMRTVEKHLERIFRKLGVSNRTAAAYCILFDESPYRRNRQAFDEDND